MMKSAMVLTVVMIVGAILVAPAPSTAAPPAKDLVQAGLVADVASVKAGQPFTAGVLLKMKPHWHVYWKNPGDSGLPTTVEWKLPEGWKAGELHFPIPVNFDQPGEVAGYGYENEVLLTTTITPPDNLSPAEPVELSAEVSWLVCEKVCIPGNATVKLELPASDSAAPANQELFARWQARLPQRADEAQEKVAQTGIRRQGDKSTAFVKWTEPPADVQWFPNPPDGSGVENVQTESRDGVSEMSFDLVPAPAGPEPMSFLVAYTDQNGKRQGVEFTVKLPPADQ